jgi:undecaprenyl-phosphate 4-deoxy-4-formamido-L-arabinose transferase
MSHRSISVVVPVYRSEGSLPLLAQRLAAVLPSLASTYELILVNDGSPDNSAEVMDGLERQYPWIRGINLMRNYGQHNALLCGIREAQHQVIITMDDDLQNPPEEIHKLLAVLDEGYDAVYGYPKRESHGVLRDMASRITKLTLQRTMGVEAASRVSSFRAFRREVRSSFADFRGSFINIDVLLGWGTNRFGAVAVPNPPREIGTSNYSVGKLLRHAVNMITGYSTLPLQVASIVGFVFGVFGFCLLLYVLIRYFTTGTRVPGFAFLASVVSIFSGAQMFAMGVIGEYLARMHFRLMDRPSYAVRPTSRDQ